jgi:hypothetical protein
MIEDSNGRAVLIGGHSDSDQMPGTLYQLSLGGKDVEWTKMKQNLRTGRR